MDNAINKLLYDISQSLERIESFIGTEKQFARYQENLMMQQAVERNLEIIGEAVAKLLKIDPGIKISYSRKIVDTRNKIIHGYDQIEPENIWNIIINYLPGLKTEVDALLNER
jgi:uncharacterized protein with HEPN domain